MANDKKRPNPKSLTGHRAFGTVCLYLLPSEVIVTVSHPPENGISNAERPPAADTQDISQLDRIIERLRGENGCPWDRKQTPRDIAVYLVEEAHELMQAIETGDVADILEELGDVLFQVLFIAKLFQEKGAFDLSAAAAVCADKMIRRHPHVFADGSADTADAVLRQWHVIKRAERAQKSGNAGTSVLDPVPGSLPPLARAYRISDKAARTGFDWDDLNGVMEKVGEEWAEFQREIHSDDAEARDRAAMEFGDLLFTLTNVARHARFHPDTALVSATRKFEDRFRHMEAAAAGRHIDDVPREEKERMWEDAKKAIP